MDSVTRHEQLLSNLCAPCRTFFDSPRQIGTSMWGNEEFSLRLPHTKRHLQQAAAGGCGLCWLMVDSLEEAKSILDHWKDWDDVPLDEDLGLKCALGSNIGVYICTFRVWRSEPTMEDSLSIAYLEEITDDVAVPYQDSWSTLLAADITDSETTMSMASEWLSDCLQNHECSSCNNEKWAPTRLVDVGEEPGAMIPRVVLAEYLEGDVEWLTLSHCWGKTPQCKLLKENLPQFQLNLPIKMLSKTFQHALFVTRRLGFRFIWIDSLCIIQDDNEDWKKEAAVMNKIYSLSKCTLSASHASDGSEGCFTSRNPRAIFPVLIPSPLDRDPSAHRFFMHRETAEDRWTANSRKAPLYTRAWVVQERLLSPRALYFGKDQVLWGCGQSETSESFPRGTAPEDVGIWWQFEGSRRRFQSLLHEPDWESYEYDKLWSDLAEFYSSTEITFPTDRQVAFSGMAMEIGRFRKSTYIHGMWHDEALLWNLLWGRSGDANTRPKEWVAPTWSWMSLNSPIRCFNPYDRSAGIPRCSVVSFANVMIPRSSSTQIHDGLVIRGTLKAAWCDREAFLGGNRFDSIFYRKGGSPETVNTSMNPDENGDIANIILAALAPKYQPSSIDIPGLGHSGTLSISFDTVDYTPASNVVICLPLVDVKSRVPRYAGLILEPVYLQPEEQMARELQLPIFRRAGYYHQLSTVYWPGQTNEITLVLI